MLARITDRNIPCVYIHVYRITKNWGPGPYNSLRHADNGRYFSGLSLMQNGREVHMFYLARELGNFHMFLLRTCGTCSCWEKGNFIMSNEFKYGQMWKIWPSLLSLSLYSTFNRKNRSMEKFMLPRKMLNIQYFAMLSIMLNICLHCFCLPPIIMGDLILKICQNFVGIKFFLRFVGR